MKSSRGFTLVEMLTVVSIMTVLMGLLMGGITIVRKNAARSEANVLLEQIAHAVASYMDENAITAAGFESNLLEYLYKAPMRNGKAPYLTLGVKYWADSVGAPTTPNLTYSASCDTILDPWGDQILCSKGSLPLGVNGVIASGSAATYSGWNWNTTGRYSINSPTGTVHIRSMAGTADTKTTKDDVVWTYSNEGGWKRGQ